MKQVKLFGLVSALAFSIMTAQAVVIIDYDADLQNYVTGLSDLADGGYTLGDPDSLVPGAYSGPIFHGVQDIGTRSAIQQFGGDDLITLVPGAAGESALILFKDENWLNGATSANSSITATDIFSVLMRDFGVFDAGRLVIRQGSDYFISSSGHFTGEGTAVSVNPTSLTYLSYDPATSTTTFGASDNSLISGGEISNVTEIGFLFVSNAAGAVGNNTRIFIDDIDATMTVIPEPSTYALLAIGVAGLYLLRRQRS